MVGLFIALGITIFTLSIILLWFVPHLIQQQRNLKLQIQQTSDEAEHLRGLLFAIIQEQESVLEENPPSMELEKSGGDVHLLEQQLQTLQEKIEWYVHCARRQAEQDNASWAYLLSLLSAILDRLQAVSEEWHDLRWDLRDRPQG